MHNIQIQINYKKYESNTNTKISDQIQMKITSGQSENKTLSLPARGVGVVSFIYFPKILPQKVIEIVRSRILVIHE